MGVIPEQYPYLQVHTDPSGLIHLVIGEGMLPESLSIETASVTVSHNIL